MIAARPATVMATVATGWRRAGRSMARTAAPLPARPASRPSSGIRGLSTRLPSSASVAGSTVSEPSTASSTTAIVPTAIAVKVASLVRNIPASAMHTARPEVTTARPAVAAATDNAASSDRPARRSSRSRRK